MSCITNGSYTSSDGYFLDTPIVVSELHEESSVGDSCKTSTSAA